jgi:hypothetical protein
VPDTSRFLTALGRVIRSLSSGGRTDGGSTDALGPISAATGLLSPGQDGPAATVEIDPRRLRSVRLGYTPQQDGEPDPGEIVWTWVPYVERDGRGKDRPVLVIARQDEQRVYAVKLTSRSHDGDRDFLALGEGPWDAQGRPSWVDIDQVYSVHAAGMRREAAALDLDRFVRVADALHRRYGWAVGR